MNTTPRMSAAQFRDMIKQDRSGGKDLVQMQRNRDSNDRGRGFENLLIKGCAYYAAAGEAVITKTYEPYICTKVYPDGRFEGRWLDKADPDFQGTLSDGRSIVFEAKSTSKSRIQHSALTDKQVKLLRKHNDMGALAFVAIEIQGRFYSLPFFLWDDMKGYYGKKFLMHDDIKVFEVKYDGSVRFLEYEDGSTIMEEMKGR